MSRFVDREDAGRKLATAVVNRLGPAVTEPQRLAVVALARGGVAVGYEVAHRLGCPLHVLAVQKLGVPGQPELAMGAIASGGVQVIDTGQVSACGVSEPQLQAVLARETLELQRRETVYAAAALPARLAGLTVLLVDDGIATGCTIRAAIQAVARLYPQRLLLAVPVAAPEILTRVRDDVDDIVCLETPDPLSAIGLWYQRFEQVDDETVRSLVARAKAAAGQTVSETPGL